jgi:hypothetical protein
MLSNCSHACGHVNTTGAQPSASWLKLALRRLRLASDHASGYPKLRLASTNQLLEASALASHIGLLFRHRRAASASRSVSTATCTAAPGPSRATARPTRTRCSRPVPPRAASVTSWSVTRPAKCCSTITTSCSPLRALSPVVRYGSGLGTQSTCVSTAHPPVRVSTAHHRAAATARVP